MYDPKYIPTGPNNRINPYYKTINHVRIAKRDSNRTEFLMSGVLDIAHIDGDDP